jgi:hypothetical protein
MTQSEIANIWKIKPRQHIVLQYLDKLSFNEYKIISH